MSYRVLAQFKACTVCGDDLRPPQTALVAERDATPADVRDAIENNEACERCWNWAHYDESPQDAPEPTRSI